MLEKLQSLFINVVSASAQNQTTLPNLLPGAQNISYVVGWALNIIIGIGWAIAFIYLALGFIKYITSKGDKTATADAQSMVTYAIIGAVGLLLLGTIRSILMNQFGANTQSGLEQYIPQ